MKLLKLIDGSFRERQEVIVLGLSVARLRMVVMVGCIAIIVCLNLSISISALKVCEQLRSL